MSGVDENGRLSFRRIRHTEDLDVLSPNLPEICHGPALSLSKEEAKSAEYPYMMVQQMVSGDMTSPSSVSTGSAVSLRTVAIG